MDYEKKAYRICVYGIVQGVGFRPFVSRIAMAEKVRGSVANRGSYVEIFVSGEETQIAEFRRRLEADAPERSAILRVTMHEIPVTDARISVYQDFEIIESEHEAGSIFVSPDIATCDKCKAELYDPKNRRYMHPFINCTACGPRLTILDAMPYDRERTSMKEFPMCPACEKEYTSPKSRRYDAQPVCCNDCGPEVYLINLSEGEKRASARGREAITEARKAIIAGKVIAIKGIGGFHLCCNARDEAAVARLRKLKRRPAKPFAVMTKNLAAAERICEIPDDEIRQLLDGHQKPIVLMRKKKDLPAGEALAPSVAPDNPKVGVMLPYAPVQMLLFDYNDDVTMMTDVFVMTSGNVSGAPICRTDEDAIRELSGFCDIILSHDRKIRLRADDSVTDIYEGKPYMIRRSRGFAPLPVMTETDLHGAVLGIGGELKNTFCVGKDQLLYESPYVGDMADLRTVKALEESVIRMEELLETEPSLVVCDLHPLYNTTRVAEEQGIPVMKIQHHYAHILSCMAENDFQGKCVGLSFDGTGFGTDETIWGGEVLVCDYQDFRRVGNIKPFAQAGGDASAKEGWRIAASMLHSLYGEEAETIAEKIGLCTASELRLIGKMADRKINTVTSTSAGRLFDAVSAILGVRKFSTFEGEASTTLQFRAEAYAESVTSAGAASGNVSDAETDAAREAVGDPETAVLEVLKSQTELLQLSALDGRDILQTDKIVRIMVSLAEKNETNKAAYLFHSLLAKQMAAAAESACEKYNLNDIALSGGVFQNTLLLSLTERELKKKKRNVMRHHLIPPNDGGLALGQAAYGLHHISNI